MRILSIAAAGLSLAVMAACASAPTRAPVTFAPMGTYVQVQPEPAEYTAVATTETGWAARVGDQVITGEHWVDDEGLYHRVETTGPCAGMESVWEYDVMGDRVTFNLVSDECPNRDRDLASTYVYERR